MGDFFLVLSITDYFSVMSEIATVGIGVAAVGSIIIAKPAVGAAIPTLMSTFATVVPGVGSIMPFWIGPFQAFAGRPVSLLVVVGVILTSVGVHSAYKWLKFLILK